MSGTVELGTVDRATIEKSIIFPKNVTVSIKFPGYKQSVNPWDCY